MKTRLALLSCVIAVSGYAQSPGTFTATADMITPRSWHTATLLPDGRVLIAGGFVNGIMFSPTDSAELYDPSTGTFAATGSMTIARYDQTATLLPNGRVLIAGGGDATGQLALSAELYDPTTGTFTPTGSMAAGHWRATLLNNSQVLMALPPDSTAELYDPMAGTFTATGGYADTTTLWLAETATMLAGGKTLIAGDSFAELYDPATGRFNPTGAMIYGYAAVGRSATLLMNGKVLFAGGELDRDFDGGEPWPPYYPYSELYDPTAGNFAATANMTDARWEHTATLLPDGSVLIAGGGPTAYQSAELYDPARGTFSSLGNMTAPRFGHTATLLKDGKVLIAGGPQSSAELYTPSVLAASPVLLSLSGDGRGQGAIWRPATGQIASSANPATAGDVLSMYTNSLFEGGVIPPQVAIGGKLAEILYFGDAPGYPGYFQVNFRVPNGVAPGPAVPVRLTYLDRPSNAVTMGVQ